MKTLLITLAVIAIALIGYDISITLSAHDYILNSDHGWYKCVHDARNLGISIADYQQLSDSAVSLAYQMIDAGYSVSVDVHGDYSLIAINDHAGHEYQNLYVNGEIVKTAIKAIPVI